MNKKQKKRKSDTTFEGIEKALDAHSASLSSSVRIISLSIIAALWGFSNSDSINISPDISNLGLWAFTGAVVTLTLDFLQLLCGYFAYFKVFNQYCQGDIGEELFESKDIDCLPWLLHKVTFLLFALKLILTALTTGAFLKIIYSLF